MQRPQFVSDDEILSWLKRPRTLSWIAVKLGTTLERCASIRDRHKIDILKTRIEEHKQTAAQIAYQLELVNHYDQINDWIRKHYDENR